MPSIRTRWVELNNDPNAILVKALPGGTDGCLLKCGTSAAQKAMSVAGNVVQMYIANSVATGTVRNIYTRLYLTGGAGGEAIRSFCTVSNNAPADTVNGIHASLSFGSTAGNITGLGTGARCTLHVPDRSLTGTWAAIQAEAYADGSSSANGGTASLLRCVIDGDATGKAALEDSINLLEISCGTNASGNLVSGVGNEPTWASATHKIRINCNGTTMYLVAVLA